MTGSSIYTVLLWCCCVSLVSCSEAIPGLVENEDGTGTITMTAAVLGEEETHSPFMPGNLRCDACRIIAYLLTAKFDKEHNKMKSVIEKKGRLSELDVIEVFETVCEDKFEGVGVKEVKGQTRLSGPGLETKDIPGVMQGGGKWPYRLRSMCATYAGDVGEEEIYMAYVEHKQDLVNFLCRGTGILGDCVTEKTKSTQTEEKKVKEVNEENEVKEEKEEL